ncbi:NAD(+)--dinitrogen-reductase ADP-D-ribosyltransferase [Magnetospirillum fulvum]|uniref:NAD+---dinitrogen-reductase ADP-D-ribosyltransferase n=1 Tax=Magnetospirillum fulvum TaxID=1082 RepID=A0A1H6H5Z8_MAGFU|nr:NAD(+)--dinitrogen-reductase ADP-D-ribosyltransferase [Magnetospirillum fulvum]SEH31161.1 NAD+---dinitrogen-reductase ADP-D-ribosyltransferase [Magnetospirillum fulvum]
MTTLPAPDLLSPAPDTPPIEDPDQWYSTSMVGIPPRILASSAFNRSLRRLTIHGTRETHPGLFHLLDRSTSQTEAAAAFAHYMAQHFGLGPPAPDDGPAESRRTVTSYLEVLRGWGADSNSAKAAVLKGWVESRFGIVPVFHKEPLGLFPSPAWGEYLHEKTDIRFHNNCIHQQIDLLYEYGQWSIRHFKKPGPRFVRLWRGTNDFEGQRVGERIAGRLAEVRLNNLVSFSGSQERAEEFGDWVLETEIPTVKLLFFPGLLDASVLNSEGEFLVIGGCYKVRAYHGYI